MVGRTAQGLFATRGIERRPVSGRHGAWCFLRPQRVGRVRAGGGLRRGCCLWVRMLAWWMGRGMKQVRSTNDYRTRPGVISGPVLGPDGADMGTSYLATARGVRYPARQPCRRPGHWPMQSPPAPAVVLQLPGLALRGRKKKSLGATSNAAGKWERKKPRRPTIRQVLAQGSRTDLVHALHPSHFGVWRSMKRTERPPHSAHN